MMEYVRDFVSFGDFTSFKIAPDFADMGGGEGGHYDGESNF